MKKLITIVLGACICSPVLASPNPYGPYGPTPQSRAWYPANPGVQNQYPMRRPGFNPWMARNAQSQAYVPAARPQYRPMQSQRQALGYPGYNRWSAPVNRGWGQPRYPYQAQYQAQRSAPGYPNQAYQARRPMQPQMAYGNMRQGSYPQYRNPQYRMPQYGQWQARQPYARMSPPRQYNPRMTQWPMYPRVAQRSFPAFNPNVPSQYQAHMMQQNMYGPNRRAAMPAPMAYRQVQPNQNLNHQRQAAMQQWAWSRQNIAGSQMAKPYRYQAPQRNYQQYPAGWNSRKVSYTK